MCTHFVAAVGTAELILSRPLVATQTGKRILTPGHMCDDLVEPFLVSLVFFSISGKGLTPADYYSRFGLPSPNSRWREKKGSRNHLLTKSRNVNRCTFGFDFLSGESAFELCFVARMPPALRL